MMSFAGIRGFVYTVFGTIVLTTLWVTSLTFLSAPQSATALLTAVGADVLNPFLVKNGTGLSEAYVAGLQASAKAHPSQPVALPSLLKVQVLGRDIAGHTYADIVHVVYGRVAQGYYTGGINAVFQVPAELQQVLTNFGMFNPNNIPLLPGGPTVNQLPPFLQPFFVVIGLTPETFTATGHQKLLDLLPWFWLAVGVFGVLAVLLNPSGKKIDGLANGIIHSSWPIAAILVGLWIASLFYVTQFAQYVGVMAVIRGAFLPVYGGALAVGVVTLLLVKFLPSILQRGKQQPEPQPAMVGAPASPRAWPTPPAPAQMPPTMPSAGSMPQVPPSPTEPPASEGSQG